jgi:hypothetical protein
MRRQRIACNGRNSGEITAADLESENRVQSISATPMDLLRNPNIRKKFLILAFDWVANAVVYNGLSYNTTNLGVSDYLAFFISKYYSYQCISFAGNSMAIHWHSETNSANVKLQCEQKFTVFFFFFFSFFFFHSIKSMASLSCPPIAFYNTIVKKYITFAKYNVESYCILLALISNIQVLCGLTQINIFLP